jgi:3-oxoacyl-[acyl-carrier protein] reductase
MGILNGKKAIIIGASGGIGLACAKEFIAEGAIVSGSFRKMNDSLSQLEGTENFSTFQLDLNNQENIQPTLKTAINDLGGVNILVNASGISNPELLHAANIEKWHNVIESNLMSVFYTMQGVIVPMIKSGGGSIVNISSVFGIKGGVGQSSYCAAKAGIIGMTKAAAVELAAKKIRINAVAPGFIETAMTENFSDKQRQQYLSEIPMKRFGTVKEVAELCVFLASDKSTYITGQTFIIDGGLSA